MVIIELDKFDAIDLFAKAGVECPVLSDDEDFSPFKIVLFEAFLAGDAKDAVVVCRYIAVNEAAYEGTIDEGFTKVMFTSNCGISGYVIDGLNKAACVMFDILETDLRNGVDYRTMLQKICAGMEEVERQYEQSTSLQAEIIAFNVNYGDRNEDLFSETL